MARSAREGDRVSLARELAQAGAHGRFALQDAADVAHAVVAREIKNAATPHDAKARLDDVRACAFAVDDVLADRMNVGDAVGGDAALLRLETGALGAGAARDHALSADDSWRAVAMWGMTRGGDHDLRARGLVDGSPLVRRAALHAIVERDDGRDVAAVLDVAQRDPEPIVRSSAVRALSRLSGVPDDVTLRLRDLWTAAHEDDGLREDIARAFASPAIQKVGGLEALAHYLGISEGNHAVGVASAILGSSIDDAGLRASAAARLLSALKTGGHRARLHAIAVTPLGHSLRAGDEGKPFLDALIEGSHAEDLDVKLAALGRLATANTNAVAPKERTAAIEALVAIAAPGPTASSRAARARLLLAEAGDIRVQAWVEQDLQAKDPNARLSAAEALVAMGRGARAAPLLADEDASVRARAACSMLLAARLK